MLEPMGQRIEGGLTDQICLGNENLIRKTNLTARLLTVIELVCRVFGVDERQDGVEQVLLGDFVVHEKRLRNRSGVCQPRGFNDHAVKTDLTLAATLSQILQSRAQILTNGATHATVTHLDDVLRHITDQNFVVNVFLTKFVFNHGNFLAMRLTQHAL